MIKALICLSLATLDGAFSAQASTKPIQTMDLVRGVVYLYGDEAIACGSWARVLLLGSCVFLCVECLSAVFLCGLCMVAVMEHTNGMWGAACVLRCAAGGIVMVEWQNA